MDKTLSHHALLREVVEEYGAYDPSHGSIKSVIAIDEKRGQYLLMGVGWDGTRRICSVVFHAQLKDGKVYIEWDGTSPSMTEELLARGLAREDLVLAFEREPASPQPVGA